MWKIFTEGAILCTPGDALSLTKRDNKTRKDCLLIGLMLLAVIISTESAKKFILFWYSTTLQIFYQLLQMYWEEHSHVDFFSGGIEISSKWRHRNKVTQMTPFHNSQPVLQRTIHKIRICIGFVFSTPPPCIWYFLLWQCSVTVWLFFSFLKNFWFRF
jgi:hypothetical protein